jgi:phosphatidylglycerol:prolipoprotein diacylglycerol transferase
LHYFGAILLGAIAFYFYAKKMGLDMWLALDAVVPGLLLAQAVARPANFINQELYGQPTNLPWGIKIQAENRIAPWNNMVLYPEETTRFHPTFAYEMIWNFFAAGILFILARRYKDKMKPGVIFGAWLILAGVGRNIIEFFRPDQPGFTGTNFSYSRLVAILMVIAGIVIILAKYKVLKFLPAGEDTYSIAIPLEERLKAKKGDHRSGTSKSDQIKNIQGDEKTPEQ